MRVSLPMWIAGPARNDRRCMETPYFVDFRDVWLAYNDELLAANHFAV